VNAVEQRPPKGDRGAGMSSGAKQQIDFNEHGPGDNHVPSRAGQQFCGESVTSAFVAIEGRYQWPGVADDQPASRANTSSTRCERLSSSSITPAYGSGSGCWVTNSVIKEENEVLRRSASRSRRAATAGGSEIVRRTVAIASV
jgi:hypothetical protein